MKNITVTVPDEVYRKARVKAAERDGSVSGLVREFLIRLADGEQESDFDRRKRLQDELLASIDRFRASDRLTREQVHERRAIR